METSLHRPNRTFARGTRLSDDSGVPGMHHHHFSKQKKRVGSMQVTYNTNFVQNRRCFCKIIPVLSAVILHEMHKVRKQPQHASRDSHFSTTSSWASCCCCVVHRDLANAVLKHLDRHLLWLVASLVGPLDRARRGFLRHRCGGAHRLVSGR